MEKKERLHRRHDRVGKTLARKTRISRKKAKNQIYQTEAINAVRYYRTHY